MRQSSAFCGGCAMTGSPILENTLAGRQRCDAEGEVSGSFRSPGSMLQTKRGRPSHLVGPLSHLAHDIIFPPSATDSGADRLQALNDDGLIMHRLASTRHTPAFSAQCHPASRPVSPAPIPIWDPQSPIYREIQRKLKFLFNSLQVHNSKTPHD